jgi:hypothetical protein
MMGASLRPNGAAFPGDKPCPGKRRSEATGDEEKCCDDRSCGAAGGLILFLVCAYSSSFFSRAPIQRRANDLGVDSSQETSIGTIMTTTLVYEPIAHISDDYFWPPKADGSVSSRDNTDDQGVIETEDRPNITDGTASGSTATLPEANGKEGNNVHNAWEIMGSPMRHYCGQVQGPQLRG